MPSTGRSDGDSSAGRRSRLSRRSPIRRGTTPLKRRKPLLRRSPMKPSAKRSRSGSSPRRSSISTDSLPFPKQKKKDRPGEKRKRLIKRKDREFKQHIPEGARCAVGRDCLGRLVKHHKKHRRHIDS